MSKLEAFRKVHRRYLQESQPELYLSLQKSGQLQSHLDDVAENALHMEERLTVDQISAINANPKLQQDYLAKVKALEEIPLVVDELVQREVLFQPQPLAQAY